MSPDQFGGMQSCRRKLETRSDNERTGCARLTRDIGRDGQTRTEPEAPASLENVPVTPLELNQGAELEPTECDVGSAACKMDRIVSPIAAGDKLLDPAGRIIVDAHESGSRTAKTGMIEQGEMVKAKLVRGCFEKRSEIFEVRAITRGFSEAIAKPPHRQPARIARRACANPQLPFCRASRNSAKYLTNK